MKLLQKEILFFSSLEKFTIVKGKYLIPAKPKHVPSGYIVFSQ